MHFQLFSKIIEDKDRIDAFNSNNVIWDMKKIQTIGKHYDSESDIN